jgi:hypothetical protein
MYRFLCKIAVKLNVEEHVNVLNVNVKHLEYKGPLSQLLNCMHTLHKSVHNASQCIEEHMLYHLTFL